MSTKLVMGITATGRRCNRSWPEALKREIVAASYARGASVSRVARRYDVNANQVFNWRRLYRDAAREPAIPRLLPVMVTPEPADISRAAAAIAIDLAGRYCVRVDSGFDAQALRRVLDVLEGR